jgi:hypothetical protein
MFGLCFCLRVWVKGKGGRCFGALDKEEALSHRLLFSLQDRVSRWGDCRHFFHKAEDMVVLFYSRWKDGSLFWESW